MRVLSHGKGSRRAGFGVLEMMLSIALFAGLLAAFSISLRANAGDQALALGEAATRKVADQAIAGVRVALSQTHKATGFPQVLAQGGAAALNPALAYPPAIAFPGMPAPNELVFLQPSDADNDGWPDVDVNGDMVIDPVPSVIAVTGEADGTNSLIVMDGAGNRTTLARRVGSLVVDDSTSSGFAIPLDSVRLRVLLATNPGLAQPVVKTFEVRIKLPNLEDLP